MLFTGHNLPSAWALVDCNSFYCNCERLARPDLRNKPVAVLSNNDGCLIALSNETKVLGYKMGDVYFLLERQLKRDKVTAFSSNYTLYGDVSQRIMSTIKTLVPVIDQYSIDETFVPLDNVLAIYAKEVGWAMHNRVQAWIGMPVRVGVGPTRTLAKLANLWAKRINRVYELKLGTAELERILEATPTVDIWGIGRRMSAKLYKYGITNARQLRDVDLDFAKKILTIVGQRTVRELRGEQCIMDDTAPVPRKTLINSRSLGRGVTSKDDLMEALSMHCTIAAERLRQEHLEAAGLSIHILTGHYLENYFSTSSAVKLIAPTNITDQFIKAAKIALNNCYKTGIKYMKSGIMLYDITNENAQRQMSLLEAYVNIKDKRQRKLMKAMDKVNDKYGRDTLHYLAQGPVDARWHMTRRKMSGRITTQWQELLKVNTLTTDN